MVIAACTFVAGVALAPVLDRRHSVGVGFGFLVTGIAGGLGVTQYLAVFRGQPSCAEFMYSFLRTVGWVGVSIIAVSLLGLFGDLSIYAESNEGLTARQVWWAVTVGGVCAGAMLTSLANWSWHRQLFWAKAADLPQSIAWQITLGELLLIVTLGSTILGLASMTARWYVPG